MATLLDATILYNLLCVTIHTLCNNTIHIVIYFSFHLV